MCLVSAQGFVLFAPEAAVSRRYRRDRDEAFDRFVGVVPAGSPEAG